MELTSVADPHERRPYPFDIDDHELTTIDLRPCLRAALTDVIAGVPASTISGRFHATVVAAGIEMVRRAQREAGPLPIVLGGGCFQNARLVEDLIAALTPTSRVYVAERVPPNDGGLALGQAVIAAARLRQGGDVAYGASQGAR